MSREKETERKNNRYQVGNNKNKQKKINSNIRQEKRAIGHATFEKFSIKPGSLGQVYEELSDKTE